VKVTLTLPLTHRPQPARDDVASITACNERRRFREQKKNMENEESVVEGGIRPPGSMGFEKIGLSCRQLEPNCATELDGSTSSDALHQARRARTHRRQRRRHDVG
jgi:hypothetical protein